MMYKLINSHFEKSLLDSTMHARIQTYAHAHKHAHAHYNLTS